MSPTATTLRLLHHGVRLVNGGVRLRWRRPHLLLHVGLLHVGRWCLLLKGWHSTTTTNVTVTGHLCCCSRCHDLRGRLLLLWRRLRWLLLRLERRPDHRRWLLLLRRRRLVLLLVQWLLVRRLVQRLVRRLRRLYGHAWHCSCGVRLLRWLRCLLQPRSSIGVRSRRRNPWRWIFRLFDGNRFHHPHPVVQQIVRHTSASAKANGWTGTAC
jgi:hypothetical protein